MYLPPCISVSEYVTFVDLFADYLLMWNGRHLILGDFNTQVHKPQDTKTLKLYELLATTDLVQLNHFSNSNGRILDLVLSNISCKVSTDDCALFPIDLHHPPLNVFFELRDMFTSSFPQGSDVVTLNFRRANLIALYEDFSRIDWHGVEFEISMMPAVTFIIQLIRSFRSMFRFARSVSLVFLLGILMK